MRPHPVRALFCFFFLSNSAGTAVTAIYIVAGERASCVILFGENPKVTAATVEDAVATLLKDGSLGLSDIASAAWTSNNAVGDALIIPAMLEAGVKADEIINAYFDTTAEAGVTTVDTDLKVSRSGSTYTGTVPAGTTKAGDADLALNAIKSDINDYLVKGLQCRLQTGRTDPAPDGTGGSRSRTSGPPEAQSPQSPGAARQL